jgi:S-DNA-T family DNA segregation ATPase FtsK/SpoIIIE
VIHAEQQQRPQGWGDVAIEVFVKGIGTMVLKSLWWLFCRPKLWVPLAIVGGFVYLAGPIAAGAVVVIFALILHTWWTLGRESFTRFIGRPVYVAWRRFWKYQLQWRSTMIDYGMLKVVKMRKDRVPKIIGLETNEWRDRLHVRLVSGQHVEDMEKVAYRLAGKFKALEVKVVEGEGMEMWLIFRYHDPLIETIPALPIDEDVDLRAIRLGLTEEGDYWTIPAMHQQGSHMLVVATTGGGKSGVPWSLIRALCPLIRDGLVQFWVADPKGGVEFKRGTTKDGKRSLWYRYADDYTSINEMLKDLVMEMDARAARQADTSRIHEPTVDEPIIYVLIDEILSVTALESSTRRVATQALMGKVLTKGRALGINMIALSQDATKAMLSTRNFYRLRWAGRLDDHLQPDMVLGPGARDMGARCDDHKVIPHNLPGVGFIKIDGVREPVRVRAAFVDEPDIDEMVQLYAPVKASSDQPKATVQGKKVDVVIGPIVPPDEQVDEIESLMRFYNEKVTKSIAQGTIEFDTSTEELDVVE